MYFGFDRLQYPGGDVLAALKATGAVHFVAAYLAPAPSQHSTTWMPHVADLQAAGWGIVPIYVGQQAPGGPGSHHLTVDQAHQDATNVADLAATAQLPDNSVVYLDVEAGGTLAADHLAYVTAWIEGVKQTAYRPGVYCSARTTATQIVAAAAHVRHGLRRLRSIIMICVGSISRSNTTCNAGGVHVCSVACMLRLTKISVTFKHTGLEQSKSGISKCFTTSKWLCRCGCMLRSLPTVSVRKHAPGMRPTPFL